MGLFGPQRTKHREEDATRVALRAVSARSCRTSTPGWVIKVNELQAGTPDACIADVIAPRVSRKVAQQARTFSREKCAN